MKIKLAAFALGVALASTSAMAEDTVSCTRDTVGGGGGAFNFTCKPENGKVFAANYCIPYLSQNPTPPRGAADAINAWVEVVNTHTSLNFIDQGAISGQICGVPGSHQVRQVGSNN